MLCHMHQYCAPCFSLFSLVTTILGLSQKKLNITEEIYFQFGVGEDEQNLQKRKNMKQWFWIRIFVSCIQTKTIAKVIEVNKPFFEATHVWTAV